jgi:hypothetical protein
VCLEFFHGEEFRICTEIAGIAPEGKFQLKSIAGKVEQKTSDAKRCKEEMLV